MSKQQTAVEWLTENMPNIGSYIPLGVSLELHAKFQQALQMEREQIETAYIVGIIHPLEMEASKQAKQYFNDTYGTDKN